MAPGAAPARPRPGATGSTSSPRWPAARSASSTASTAACTRCCSTPPTPRSPTSRCPPRLAALAEPERRRRLVHEIPDDDGFFQRVVLDKVGPHVAGRRSRHRLRARRRHLGRGRRRRSRRAGDGGARRPAHRRGRQRHGLRAVLQLQLRRPVDDLRGHAAPAHADGPVRRRRPLRRDLRRRHAHVHAHPLGPRSAAGPEAAARARRPPPDAPDRRAVRPARPRPGGAGHARRPQRHRLRRPHLRPAADGLRPPGRRSPPRAAGQGLRRHLRGRRPDRRRRRVHRRAPRPPHPRPAGPPRRRRCPSSRRRPCSSRARTTRRPASGPLPRRRAAWPRSGGRPRTPGCSPRR